jgi:hypothetical protein
MRYSTLCVALSVSGIAGGVNAQPVIDGKILPGDGWVLLTEAANAAPVLGGSATTSDRVAETSTFHHWNGISNVDVPMNDNRGDVINVYYFIDADALYLAVAGPTVPFNAFGDQSSGASNDQGDLFIAIDASGAAPSSSLFIGANNAHTGFGVKAVDFLGWAPTAFFGVQFVDNGAGGNGFASVQAPGGATSVGGAQNGAGPFRWMARINGAAAYDTHNINAGEFEVRIPWANLGLTGAPSFPIRVAAYTTQNYGGSDAYDSAPGIGNGIVHEQVGDCPGDPDGPGMTDRLAACDAGSNFGSTAAANFIAGPYSATPGRADGVNTIEEYLVIAPACPCVADFDGSGGTPDANDVDAFFVAWLAGEASADADCSGGTPDANDVDQFFVEWLAGGC